MKIMTVRALKTYRVTMAEFIQKYSGLVVDSPGDNTVMIWRAMTETSIEAKMGVKGLVIPGLAESESNSIRQMTRWNVLVGQLSGFLVPLFVLEHQRTQVCVNHLRGGICPPPSG
jgi:hypothetical protein